MNCKPRPGTPPVFHSSFILPNSSFRESTPARNRTWISTFGGWRRGSVGPPGHEPTAEGVGLEPTRPEGHRLSRPARYQFRAPFRIRRQGTGDRRHPIGCVSCLLFPVSSQWSRGESNPVTVFARHSARPRATPLCGSCRSDLGGSRTHIARASGSQPDLSTGSSTRSVSCGPGSRTRPSGL